MSGILGVFTPRAALPDDPLVEKMLAPMKARGADHSGIWRDSGAVLAVTRHDWEFGPGYSGDVHVAADGDVVVAADASIYYRDDLRRRLAARDVRARADTPSHLVLAAYRAWGEECAERLEGDFAFILWDRRQRRVLCSRDLGGTRPLYYAEVGGSLIVASTIGSIVAHPDCPRDLNLTAVAETASGLFGASDETCYRAVSRLPVGCNLRWNGGVAEVTRFWAPPVDEPADPRSFESAAEELRELLCRAVEERLAPDGPTGVWLSGGYDSTTIFAAGERVLAGRGRGDHLTAVSGSYPVGDPGREDEFIQAVVDFWGSPVRWVDVTAIPLLDRAELHASFRDEPLAHPFEAFNRALADSCREVGAHVAFTGVGGDPLFALTRLYLADLFRTGRWRSLAREWKARRGSRTGFRNFFRWSVQPVLPDSALRIAARLRGGRPLRGPLHRPVASWIRADFAGEHALAEREENAIPPRNGLSFRAYETYLYLIYPYTSRVWSMVCALALESGVELRGPLTDRRVIEFAWRRPWQERSSRGETKRLLRASMRGLLPDEVLAPRAYRTGLSSGYFQRSMRENYAQLLLGALESPRLAELGIVDRDILWDACHTYLRRGAGGALELQLFLTLQTELWLRNRESRRSHGMLASDVPIDPSVASVSAA